MAKARHASDGLAVDSRYSAAQARSAWQTLTGEYGVEAMAVWPIEESFTGYVVFTARR